LVLSGQSGVEKAPVKKSSLAMAALNEALELASRMADIGARSVQLKPANGAFLQKKLAARGAASSVWIADAQA